MFKIVRFDLFKKKFGFTQFFGGYTHWLCFLFYKELPHGLRYWRWGGRGLCLGAGKSLSLEKCLKMSQNPNRPQNGLLGRFFIESRQRTSRQYHMLFWVSIQVQVFQTYQAIFLHQQVLSAVPHRGRLLSLLPM